MEECRAECCGIYLCTVPEILEIFGHKEQKEKDMVIYINWLSMARQGIAALAFYSPETSSWKQAHMRARFAILQVLLEANHCVKVQKTSDDVKILVNADKIKTNGRPAIGAFLQKLNILKATANFENAEQLFNKYTSVSEEFLNIRQIVLAKIKPRKVYVQPHTYLQNGEVLIKEFDTSLEGFIASHVARFNTQ